MQKPRILKRKKAVQLKRMKAEQPKKRREDLPQKKKTGRYNNKLKKGTWDDIKDPTAQATQLNL